jgi:nitronate monooxygenase
VNGAGAALPPFRDRLRLPLIAAPMFRVSGPELVVAACRSGVVGAFPTSNARSPEELDAWLGEIERELGGGSGACAPYCPNIIIRQARLADDLAVLVRHRVELVIASVGSPAPVVAPLQAIGARVFADVATLRHAEKAIAAGVDGLVLLTAGAGGQTGWMNPFAFVRAVREFFDGPLVLAGGISDGRALFAATVLGCDLAYMGTRFIATAESRASSGYKRMLVESSLDDVMLTSAFTGLPTNMLLPSIVAAGLDPRRLDEEVTPQLAADTFGAKQLERPQRWRDVWSAGHSVSGVRNVLPAADLIAQVDLEFAEARAAAASLSAGRG